MFKEHQAFHHIEGQITGCFSPWNFWRYDKNIHIHTPCSCTSTLFIHLAQISWHYEALNRLGWRTARQICASPWFVCFSMDLLTKFLRFWLVWVPPCSDEWRDHYWCTFVVSHCVCSFCPRPGTMMSMFLMIFIAFADVQRGQAGIPDAFEVASWGDDVSVFPVIFVNREATKNMWQYVPTVSDHCAAPNLCFEFSWIECVQQIQT